MQKGLHRHNRPPRIAVSIRRARPSEAGFVLAWLVLFLAAQHVQSQQLPIYRGAEVRVYENRYGGWLRGEVQLATRDSINLLEPGSVVPRAIVFEEGMRLEVRRKSQSGPMIGGVVGLLLGSLSGALFVSPALPDRVEPGLVVATGGVIGLVAGALVGREFGPARWELIPLEGGRIEPARLTVTASESRSWTSVERWTRFPASEADFAMFFDAHRDSLLPVEGLWTPRGGVIGERIEGRPVKRMVVIRDGGYEGFPFVGVYVSRHIPTWQDGIIMLALSEPDDQGIMELRHVGPLLQRTRPIFVRQDGNILTLVEPDGRLALWEKSTLVSSPTR